MTTEDKLKDLILRRYQSIREFTIAIDIPYTTMDSIFRRGVGNSSVNNIIKICKALGISADALADGNIIPVRKTSEILLNDRIEVEDILADTKDILIHGHDITLEGQRLDKTSIDSIIDSMEVGIEIAKKRNNKTANKTITKSTEIH